MLVALSVASGFVVVLLHVDHWSEMLEHVEYWTQLSVDVELL